MSLLLHSLVAEFAARRAGGASMSSRWSGVEIGEYFELVLEFDPTVYCEAEVTVSFYRAPPDGLATCMHPACNFAVKSRASDSEYHTERVVRPKVVLQRSSKTRKRRSQPKVVWVHDKLLPRAAQALLSIHSFRRRNHRCGPANTIQQQSYSTCLSPWVGPTPRC